MAVWIDTLLNVAAVVGFVGLVWRSSRVERIDECHGRDWR